ncbi:MAG: AAA family ATPase, partial [Candidatus Thiodiazotropha sp.]
ELNDAVYAQRGFNVIATANNRDKGVNELSSALKRRFNVVVLPLPDDMNEEVTIIAKRVDEMGVQLDLAVPKNTLAEIKKVVTIFRELRDGETLDGKVVLKSPTGNLSTAEAISVMVGGLSQASWFGDGSLDASDISSNLMGAIIKDPVQDRAVVEEYLETVLKKRRDFSAYYKSLNDVL